MCLSCPTYRISYKIFRINNKNYVLVIKLYFFSIITEEEVWYISKIGKEYVEKIAMP